MGNIEAAQEIYDKAIKMAHEKQNLTILPLLYINFARFTFVVTRSVYAAKEIFIKGIQQNPCKLIIEGFLDFITINGGMNHVNSIDCKMAALLSPESDVSQALSFHDREEISQLYLKFVDLHGTMDEIRLAWERHRKLFPHIMRPSSVCYYSSNGSQIQSKKTEGPKSMQTNSPNHSSESPRKNVLVKHLVENHSPINMPTILPEDTPKCELKSYAKSENEKESQKSIAAEAVHVHELSLPGGSETDIINKVNDSENVAQIPDTPSEFNETERPIESNMHTICHGKLEPPELDNLSISSTDHVSGQTNKITSHDNNVPQEATSKESGNKFEGNGDDGEASVIHSAGEKTLRSDSDLLAKLKEDSGHSHPASHARTKPDAQLNLQEKVNTNHASPVYTEHSQPASGGQWAQFCYGVQGIANPNSMIHGNIQSSNPRQWQAHGPMQNQSGGTSQETFLTQSYLSRTRSLPNSQDPQASHTQLQYQLAASQAYTNPGLSFHGQHMQQPALAYAPDHQVQHASSQTQIQAYQNVSQSDEQNGYYQNFQGFSPHIWQYYQNLYNLQQEQLQHGYEDQQMNKSHKQQLTESSEARSSQKELSENQEERFQLQLQADAQQHDRNPDEKQNATRNQQNQQEKQEGSTEPNQQSMQVMNSEQSQLLYLQQQQQYYLQQQQQYQMYLQQQHLLQQQQQQQQLLLFQQQQLQLQHQPKQLQQQQQSPYPQQQHRSPLQQ